MVPNKHVGWTTEPKLINMWFLIHKRVVGILKLNFSTLLVFLIEFGKESKPFMIDYFKKLDFQ